MSSLYTIGQMNELADAFEEDGFTPELFKALTSHGRLRQVKAYLEGRAEIVMKSILTLVRTVRIAAQPAITTSSAYFREAGVKWMDTNFEREFYNLLVATAEGAELAVSKLEETSLDAPILVELGDKAETSVSQFREFLAANHNSIEWFIFYLRGGGGNLSAVYARWNAAQGGWRVFAHSVQGPGRWSEGSRIVSRT